MHGCCKVAYPDQVTGCSEVSKESVCICWQILYQTLNNAISLCGLVGEASGGENSEDCEFDPPNCCLVHHTYSAICVSRTPCFAAQTKMQVQPAQGFEVGDQHLHQPLLRTDIHAMHALHALPGARKGPCGGCRALNFRCNLSIACL